MLTGVFFLFGAGRLALHRSQPSQAIAYYSQAMASQMQYRNLHHISFWEIAIARLALWELDEKEEGVEKNGAKEPAAGDGKDRDEAKDDGDDWEKVEKDEVGGSAACWRVLEKEATVSSSPSSIP